MSAIRLNKMNVAAKISPHACTTGTSCLDTSIHHQLPEARVDEDGFDDDDADDEIGEIQGDDRDDGGERVRKSVRTGRCADLLNPSRIAILRCKDLPSPRAPKRASCASYARR